MMLEEKLQPSKEAQKVTMQPVLIIIILKVTTGPDLIIIKVKI